MMNQSSSHTALTGMMDPRWQPISCLPVSDTKLPQPTHAKDCDPEKESSTQFAIAAGSFDDPFDLTKVETPKALNSADQKGRDDEILSRFKPHQWLCSESLRRSVDLFTVPSQCHVVDPLYVKIKGADDYEDSRYRLPERLPPLILVPVHHQKHWSLGLVRPRYKIFSIYDPLHNETTIKEVATAIQRFCWQFDADYRQEDPPTGLPRQNDDFNCGILVAVVSIFQSQAFEDSTEADPDIWRVALFTLLGGSDYPRPSRTKASLPATKNLSELLEATHYIQTGLQAEQISLARKIQSCHSLMRLMSNQRHALKMFYQTQSTQLEGWRQQVGTLECELNLLFSEFKRKLLGSFEKDILRWTAAVTTLEEWSTIYKSMLRETIDDGCANSEVNGRCQEVLSRVQRLRDGVQTLAEDDRPQGRRLEWQTCDSTRPLPFVSDFL